jgi:hypothetical protein
MGWALRGGRGTKITYKILYRYKKNFGKKLFQLLLIRSLKGSSEGAAQPRDAFSSQIDLNSIL